LIVDKKAPGEKGGQTRAIAAAGIPVWVGHVPHIAHSKVIVQDGAEVYEGNFNTTVNADRFNAENLSIVRDSQWAAAYERTPRAALPLANRWQGTRGRTKNNDLLGVRCSEQRTYARPAIFTAGRCRSFKAGEEARAVVPQLDEFVEQEKGVFSVEHELCHAAL
jgi:phosphatidylserine/phosphatidylglycerophosphate/cardiolipin synthase-like enzyme